MKTPCEDIIKEIIPTIRALIAKDLCSKYGFTQIEAAKKLGITQAAISQYISLKRGGKKLRKIKALPEVKSLIKEISKGIAEEKISEKDLSNKICLICKTIRKKLLNKNR
jgi:predicted transcriptional regulator